MDLGLKGKKAIVTGGTRGIGYMIAEGFVRAGARVYIASRKPEVCEEAAAELSSRLCLVRDTGGGSRHRELVAQGRCRRGGEVFSPLRPPPYNAALGRQAERNQHGASENRGHV